MRLPTAAYGALEIALNRYIASDDRAREQCAALAGNSLQVELNDLELTLAFYGTGHDLQVMPALEAEPDVRLQGQSRAFARLFMEGEQGLASGAFRIEGDVGVAHRFARLFTSVDFDIGDWLDARVGPLPAFVLARGLRSVTALARRAADTLPRDAAEYLREETRDVIGTREHAAFAAAVQTLHHDTEQLAARIKRLAPRGRGR